MSLASFEKYPSIENSYRAKHVKKMVELYPLQNCSFLLTEKIDGANIQLFFQPQKQMKIGRRNGFLKEEEYDSFFGIQEVLPKYTEAFEIIQNYVDSKGVSIRIYGELFGPGILKRINYGDKKIRFFDCIKENVFLSPHEFLELLEDLKLQHLYVPIVKKVSSLNEALEFDVKDLASAFNSKEMVEGVVIKQYENSFRDWGLDAPFMLKAKTEKFHEKEKSKNVSLKEKDPVIEKWKGIYASYYNENRIQNLFSKEGEISSKKEIGKYINLLKQDVNKDFEKEHPEFSELPIKKQKKIMKPPSFVGRLFLAHC